MGVFPMQAVTVGDIATEEAQKLFTAHQYSDYLYFHGWRCRLRKAWQADSPSWGLLVRSRVIFGIFWLNGIVGVGTVSGIPLVRIFRISTSCWSYWGAIALTCTWMASNILNSLRPRSLPITRRQNTSVPNSIGRRFLYNKACDVAVAGLRSAAEPISDALNLVRTKKKNESQ